MTRKVNWGMSNQVPITRTPGAGRLLPGELSSATTPWKHSQQVYYAPFVMFDGCIGRLIWQHTINASNSGPHRSFRIFRIESSIACYYHCMSYNKGKGMKCISKSQIGKLGSHHFISFTQSTNWCCNCESISKIRSYFSQRYTALWTISLI
jgi:hypothetical protein